MENQLENAADNDMETRFTYRHEVLDTLGNSGIRHLGILRSCRISVGMSQAVSQRVQ